MASISDQNWLIWNQGKNPLVNFNFMLRVEMVYDLPCKSVRAFSRELEYDYIQEGGLNDYVHMRRKPITKPFTLEVERYVGVDYVDPLPLGADLALPVLLFVSRNHDQFIPGVVARTYMFTGCTVMKKTYGDLTADRPGLLVETTTLGYREMLCVDIPWSEVGDDIPGSTPSSPIRNVSGEDKRGIDLKVLAQELCDKAQKERDRAAGAYDAKAVVRLTGELQTAASALRAASKVPGGPMETKIKEAENKRRQAEAAAEAALEMAREEAARSTEAERAWQEKRAEWNALENDAERAERAEEAARRATVQAGDALKKKQSARANAEAGKRDAEAALERAEAEAKREEEKLDALKAEAESAVVQEADRALEAATAQRTEAEASQAEAEAAARQAEEEAGNLGDEETRLKAEAENARKAVEEARGRMNGTGGSETTAESALEERRRALEEAEKRAKDAQSALQEGQQRTREARQRAKEADTRAREARNTAGEARDREQSAQRKWKDAQRREEALQERIQDAQRQADNARERVEQARQRVRDAQGRVERAEEDVKDAERQVERASRAGAMPGRQAETARQNAAKAKKEDEKAEKAAEAARKTAAEAAKKSAAARDAASDAAREEAEARSALTQAASLANSLQNSLLNLTDRKKSSTEAMAACEAALIHCKEANVTTQGLPDDDLELVNAAYEEVKKYHKDTVYQARLVREIQQYVDVGEKYLASGKALL